MPATTTYNIQRRDGERWHGDIGESESWPSIAAAEAAIESLRTLGPDWLGEYRIVERDTGRVMHVMTLIGAQTITAARIVTPTASRFFQLPPVVYVTIGGEEVELFDYYPDEIAFTASEFVGLTLDAARRLKFTKDRDYLRSDAPAGTLRKTTRP